LKKPFEGRAAWFLSKKKEEREAGNRAGFDSLGQNQRVLETPIQIAACVFIFS
jgi:hypothetical protein